MSKANLKEEEKEIVKDHTKEAIDKGLKIVTEEVVKDVRGKKQMDSKHLLWGCTAVISILVSLVAFFGNLAINANMKKMDNQAAMSSTLRNDFSDMQSDVNEIKVQLAIISTKLDIKAKKD